MAIMAMATVRKINNSRLACIVALLPCFATSPTVIAGEWQFVPNLGLEATYTDNVELSTTDTTSSLVSQAIIGLNAEYDSRLASFSFSGTNNNLFFSHDSDINDNYLTLSTQARYYLWTSGPELIASANVGNINRNAANNDLGDLISGDTVQTENYSAGLSYNVNNSVFSVDTSLLYLINSVEDGIGEYNGVSAIFNTNSGSNTRTIFWQISSDFSKRSQDFSEATRTGDRYQVDALLGLITPFTVTPYIRFYDEDFSSTFTNQNQQTTSSWGPGVRWQISSHLNVDFSYNYVADDTVSDDYIATSIQWEPSARTSLNAGYSQRFFGDSYNLDIKHRTKRLTNSVSYHESLEVFDRENYEQIDLGLFLCPPDVDLTSISQCFVQSDQPNSGDFLLSSFLYLAPIESNEFSLNKRFSWASELQLARTSFAISTSASRREGLESEVVNETLSGSLTIDRKISGKSNLTFLAKYDHRLFDKNNPEGSRQEDHYRTISVTYTKALASSLSTHFTLGHVNRGSTIDQRTYKEVRAIINVTKEF